MAAELNHTILWCSDKMRSSTFLTDILGLPPPRPFHHFMVVDLANRVSVDFMEKTGPVAPQHYAFLVGEEAFAPILARIEDSGQPWWADPARTRPHEVNHHDGGSGVYFEDPDGHLLEVITRPYGGG